MRPHMARARGGLRDCLALVIHIEAVLVALLPVLVAAQQLEHLLVIHILFLFFLL